MSAAVLCGVVFPEQHLFEHYECTKALESSCPELLGNMDEMWRRQVRDDRLRTLHFNVNRDLDRTPAHPIVDLEQGRADVHSRSDRAGGFSRTAPTRVTLQVPIPTFLFGSYHVQESVRQATTPDTLQHVCTKKQMICGDLIRRTNGKLGGIKQCSLV